MATCNSPAADSGRLMEILAKTNELAQKSVGGSFIYRGEHKCHPEVSSGLYRQYKGLAVEDLQIDFIQQDILRDAKRFTSETEDLEILDQLQHYGYQTNLIDFTTDYLIALYFACDGKFDQDGRVILLRRESVKTRVPKGPASRVVAQKSIFVEPPSGLVTPDDVVTIPASMKQPILGYLKENHGIATESLYNDLHGFIRQRQIHQSYYAEFCIALHYHQMNDFSSAIEHYTKSIKLAPMVFINFVNRGQAYSELGECDLAIFDLDRAIALNASEPAAYYNRGNVYARKDEVERAVADYGKAIELNPNYANAYLNRAHCNALLSNVTEAIEDYSRVIDIGPLAVNAYCSRGATYSEQGELELAIRDFSAAIQLDPNCAKAYANRGNVNIIEGRFELAVRDCSAAIQLEPDEPISHYNRAMAQLCLSRFEEAERDFCAAIELGYDVPYTFQEEEGTVADFEQKYDLYMPASLAEILKA